MFDQGISQSCRELPILNIVVVVFFYYRILREMQPFILIFLLSTLTITVAQDDARKLRRDAENFLVNKQYDKAERVRTHSHTFYNSYTHTHDSRL